jgi:hypothetical protein
MRDSLQSLCSGGHFRYQQDCFSARYSFTLHGLPHLEQAQRALTADAAVWRRTVKASRDRFSYHNFFTMRELLHLHMLLSGKVEEPKAALPSPPPRFAPPPPVAAPAPGSVNGGAALPLAAVAVQWACDACTFLNDPLSRSCNCCGSPAPTAPGFCPRMCELANVCMVRISWHGSCGCVHVRMNGPRSVLCE